MVQVLREARAIDNAYDAGSDIKPLCGMAFVVKDNLDVLGYAFCTVAVTGGFDDDASGLHLLCMVSAVASCDGVSAPQVPYRGRNSSPER